jgi:hypothetical protein
MQWFLITASASLMATAADAAPQMPEIFRGKWCVRSHSMMERSTERDAIAISATRWDQDEIVCDLVRLRPQKPSRRVSEYRATFDCVVADAKSHLRYYRTGFYDEDHSLLFMDETNSTFTAVRKSNL